MVQKSKISFFAVSTKFKISFLRLYKKSAFLFTKSVFTTVVHVRYVQNVQKYVCQNSKMEQIFG